MTVNLAAQIAGFAVFLAFLGGLVALLVLEWNNPHIRQLGFDHFRVIVLMPAAGMFAYLVVAIFESSAGTVRFELWGLKLEGAGGPIFMWVICFLVICLAIKMLW
jgi:hypothetical protein